MTERKMAKKIVGRKYVVVEEQPELETGKIYFADQSGLWEFDLLIQVFAVDCGRIGYIAVRDPDDQGYIEKGWVNQLGANWTEATEEQQIKLLQAKVKYGNAIEADLELLSELMPLDNPELEIGEVYVCDGDIVRADVGDTVESGLTGNYYDPEHEEFIEKDGTAKRLTAGYRKALPHEVAKLEAVEKENGCEYQKPLVNKLGTVIEVGKYYKTSGELLKVTEITDLKVIYDGYKIPSREKPGIQVSQLNSFFFHELQSATPAEIEQFKEAEAREKLPKFEIGKSYTVWHSTFDCSVITVTRVDYSNDRITFKYKGKFGSYVSETQKISSEAMSTAAEVK